MLAYPVSSLCLWEECRCIHISCFSSCKWPQKPRFALSPLLLSSVAFFNDPLLLLLSVVFYHSCIRCVVNVYNLGTSQVTTPRALLAMSPLLTHNCPCRWYLSYRWMHTPNRSHCNRSHSKHGPHITTRSNSNHNNRCRICHNHNSS